MAQVTLQGPDAAHIPPNTTDETPEKGWSFFRIIAAINAMFTELYASATAVASAVNGVAAGYKLARGEIALDGSNPTTIATGLATIVTAVACLKGTAAPADNTSVLTVNFTGSDGNLDVYAWKNTGGTDPTLVASTGTETIEWIAIGT